MITSDALSLPGISHGFFTREGGRSGGIFASLNCGMGSGDDKETVRENRTIAAGKLGVSENHLLTAWQIHSPNVHVATGPWAQGPERPRADAMVTREKGLAIGILTADCGPVLFADSKAGVVGCAHAGWKGALGGVTDATLEAMERLGASRADTVAVIGPMISGAAYEVGPEFPAHFLAQDERNQRYFTPSARPGHAMFDLPAYLKSRLYREGVGTVINLGLCTFADEARFYSYRRATHRGESDYGRQISAIALKEE
ncbi:peptidoglycan editing factor PgeF [Aestuariivirga sp.]|uniref:peptidoglycan editing factor PgeF n=1 Tax=Aestuariivirga sp. TaxID=2650926 RepID=UPI0039E71487